MKKVVKWCYTISSEELFVFGQQKRPYLCGLWRFANAYKVIKNREEYENGKYQRSVSYTHLDVYKRQALYGKVFIR